MNPAGGKRLGRNPAGQFHTMGDGHHNGHQRGGINLAANRPLEEGDRVYVYIRSEELEIGIKGEVVCRYTKFWIMWQFTITELSLWK